ncbi:MAG: AtpZ/AtpI family protein [Acetatifactor sp.]|nr:AtpZ/AtpI family protein [Acetatifactor sp.]
MKKGRVGSEVYRSFALVMQFGINMLVPICLMTALGIYLDRKLGTSYLVIVLFTVGAIAGGQNIYRMAKRIYENDGDDKKNQ